MNWIDVDLGFQFYFSLLASESGGHSLVKNHKSGAIEVEVKNLDDVVEELGLDKVSLIKIDAEGAKYAILRGAMNTLKRFKPRLIMEVRVKNFNNVISLLKGLDYEIKVIKKSIHEHRRGGTFT